MTRTISALITISFGAIITGQLARATDVPTTAIEPIPEVEAPQESPVELVTQLTDRLASIHAFILRMELHDAV